MKADDPLELIAQDFQRGTLAMPVTVARILLAVAVGYAVSRAYVESSRKEGRSNRPFATALVLLSVLVAMTTMVIDDSIARAFSLVGALAIVRFRTDVEDSRDTAFVIFAVVCGMAAGLANWQVAGIGIPVVAAIAWFGAGPPRGSASPPAAPLTVLVRVASGEPPRAALEAALRAQSQGLRFGRAATARQGAALELTWTLQPGPGTDPVALVAALAQVPGVQHAEIEAA